MTEVSEQTTAASEWNAWCARGTTLTLGVKVRRGDSNHYCGLPGLPHGTFPIRFTGQRELHNVRPVFRICLGLNQKSASVYIRDISEESAGKCKSS